MSPTIKTGRVPAISFILFTLSCAHFKRASLSAAEVFDSGKCVERKTNSRPEALSFRCTHTEERRAELVASHGAEGVSGSLAQVEIPPIDTREEIGTVKHPSEFPPEPVPVFGHFEQFVFREHRFQVIALLGARLLHADHSGIHILDHIDTRLPALRPGLFALIRRIAVTDVERHHFQGKHFGRGSFGSPEPAPRLPICPRNIPGRKMPQHKTDIAIFSFSFVFNNSYSFDRPFTTDCNGSVSPAAPCARARPSQPPVRRLAQYDGIGIDPVTGMGDEIAR